MISSKETGMNLTERLVAHPSFGWSNRLHLPEYRQIELYTKPKVLGFLDPEPPEEAPMERLAAVARAALAFEAVLASRYPTALPLTSWKRCLEMPRGTREEKFIAELHRILRIVRKIVFHPHGHVDMREGVVCLNGAIDQVALSLEITAAGLDLLESTVAYWFSALSSPYPEAYVNCMIGEYFCDIVAEIKRFADEDRILYQFRHPAPFNRHFRFDCDNPKVKFENDKISFEIGELYRDPARFPIDFFFVFDDVLNIVPIEALKDGWIARGELRKWHARTPDEHSLPAVFHSRFARQKNIVGQPMT